MKKVSIIVSSFNEFENIKECLEALFVLDYPKKDYEIIVMDESTDERILEYLMLLKNKIRFFHYDRLGPVTLRRIALEKTRHPYFVRIGSDCILPKDWLKKVMKKFDENKAYGFVSTYDITGGTCTAYLKKAVDDSGGFTDTFNQKGAVMRDDTDLAFRIWDKGYKSFFGYISNVKHEHKIKPGIKSVLKYALNRLKLQRFDPLLYKLHPVRTIDFLGIKYGFWIPFRKDFKKATGQWMAGKKGFNLSSPTGAILIEPKTPLHILAIIIGGTTYAVCAKLFRLYGSIKFGKLLI